MDYWHVLESVHNGVGMRIEILVTAGRILCLLVSLYFQCVLSLVRGSKVKAMEEKERKGDEAKEEKEIKRGEIAKVRK
jgi:hypothetical protein